MTSLPKPEPSDSELTTPEESEIRKWLEEPAKELGTTPEELFLFLWLDKLDEESSEVTSSTVQE